MIICTVCNTQNHHLEVICISCGSYLQKKVNNIDLFSMIWKLIESPRAAFHEIAIAQRKNYSIFLAGLFGIGLTFGLFWILKLGNQVDSILMFMAIGILVGPFIGIIYLTVFSLMFVLITKLIKLKCKFKNIFAVSSFSFVPIVLSVIFILPLELAIFGIYFFSTNPSPIVIKPTYYYLLLTLDYLVTTWSIVLLNIGIKVLLDINWLKTSLISLGMILFFILVYLLLQQPIIVG